MPCDIATVGCGTAFRMFGFSTFYCFLKVAFILQKTTLLKNLRKLKMKFFLTLTQIHGTKTNRPRHSRISFNGKP